MIISARLFPQILSPFSKLNVTASKPLQKEEVLFNNKLFINLILTLLFNKSRCKQ